MRAFIFLDNLNKKRDVTVSIKAFLKRLFVRRKKTNDVFIFDKNELIQAMRNEFFEVVAENFVFFLEECGHL